MTEIFVLVCAPVPHDGTTFLHPIIYYQIVGCVVFASGLFMAWWSYRQDSPPSLVTAFLAASLVYAPLAPFHTHYGIWLLLDFACAALFFFTSVHIFKHTPDEWDDADERKALEVPTSTVMPPLWYIAAGRRVHGPYCCHEMLEFFLKNRLAPHSLVAKVGDSTFQPLHADTALIEIFEREIGKHSPPMTRQPGRESASDPEIPPT